jgi:hypothetical protein
MKSLFLCLLAIVLLALPARGQQVSTTTFDQVMHIDPLGDMSMTMKFSLTASEYQMWNAKYGQNKSLLKRDIGRLLSQWDTHDWKVDVNEMERQVSVSLKVHGAVMHKGGGSYEFDVPKPWKGGDRNGTTVRYNYIQSFGPSSIGQYNVTINLPEAASDIKEDTGSSGQKVLRYKVPVPSQSNGLGLGLGIALTLIGLVCTAAGFVLK